MKCTFLKTGKKYILQPYFRCYTCGLTHSKGCCVPCAFSCHRGHDLKYEPPGKFYCDCFELPHCVHIQNQDPKSIVEEEQNATVNVIRMMRNEANYGGELNERPYGNRNPINQFLSNPENPGNAFQTYSEFRASEQFDPIMEMRAGNYVPRGRFSGVRRGGGFRHTVEEREGSIFDHRFSGIRRGEGYRYNIEERDGPRWEPGLPFKFKEKYSLVKPIKFENQEEPSKDTLFKIIRMMKDVTLKKDDPLKKRLSSDIADLDISKLIPQNEKQIFSNSIPTKPFLFTPQIKKIPSSFIGQKLSTLMAMK